MYNLRGKSSSLTAGIIMICISILLLIPLHTEYRNNTGYSVQSFGTVNSISESDHYYSVDIQYNIDGITTSDTITYGVGDNLPIVGDIIPIVINPDTFDIRVSHNQSVVKLLIIGCSLFATIGVGIVAINIKELV